MGVVEVLTAGGDPQHDDPRGPSDLRILRKKEGQAMTRRIPQETREEVHERQGGKCMYCGRSVALPDGTIDHKRPIVRGGGSNKSNLQFLCSRCNFSKGAKTDGAFRREHASVGVPLAKSPGGRMPPPTPISLEAMASVRKRKKKGA